MCVYVMYYNFISKYIDLYTTDLYILTSVPSVGADPEALACPTCWMSVVLYRAGGPQAPKAKRTEEGGN